MLFFHLPEDKKYLSQNAVLEETNCSRSGIEPGNNPWFRYKRTWAVLVHISNNPWFDLYVAIGGKYPKANQTKIVVLLRVQETLGFFRCADMFLSV